MKYLVDIDGVITNETEGHDYPKRTPNAWNIKLVNMLKKFAFFTSRKKVDEEDTRSWLSRNGVQNSIHVIYDKPQYDVLIDDKSLPAPMENLDKYMNYNMKATCWRLKKGSNVIGETHDCFFCGEGIEVGDNWMGDICNKCGLIPCYGCKKCLCNVPLLSRITVVRIHEKYCCNLPEFNGEIRLSGYVDMDVINNAEHTLRGCACIEGLLK